MAAARIAGMGVAGLLLCLVGRATAQEIVELRAAAPDVLVVVLQSGPHTEPGAVNPLNLTASLWQVDGSPAAAVHRYSVPYDESPVQGGLYPVTVRHRVYLELAQPLEQGKTYQISTPHGAQPLAFDERATFCESIKVNQVGYNRAATSRFANFGVYMGGGGSKLLAAPPAYEVIEEASGEAVASGTGKYMGDDTALTGVTSGEHVYRLDLGPVPEGGPYFVTVPGCGRSRSFRVGMAASREIARTLARGLYHQRCGVALEQPHTDFTRGLCHAEVAHTFTPWSAGGWINVPAGAQMHSIAGGYHDAGDFDRRPYHTIVPLLMLAYFDAFPTHFVDNQYAIPESGNGIPDFLDEALFGLQVWVNLQITDPASPQLGGVMAGTETSRHPAYAEFSAASDSLIYGTWEIQEEVTAISAGLFAHASRLVAPYDAARAADLLSRARLAWQYLESHGNVAAAETRYLYAALQLYLATGEAPFHDRFKASATAIVVNGGTWPEQYVPGNISAKCQTAHFASYLFTDRPTDATLVEGLRGRIFGYADSGTYMGPPPEGEPYPQGVTKFMGWGASTAQGRYGDVYCFASRLTTDAAKRQTYFNAASQYGDYALGLNPMGISYVTGLGTDQPQSPLQLDSYYTKYGVSDGVTSDHVGNARGNVPGIVIYGPTEGASGAGYQTAVTSKLYPAWNSLPLQRRWGDGWSLVNGNEFTIWETMVWNAALHGCLYNASDDTTPPDPVDGGAEGGPDSGGWTDGGTGGGSPDGGAKAAPSSDDSGGCGCDVAGAPARSPWPGMLALCVLGLARLAGRRRA